MANLPVTSLGTAQQSQVQKETEIDPIIKVKTLLLPRLKDSLVNLMKIAGQILHQNSVNEDGNRSQEGLQQVFERSIEEFYSLCDQLEIYLRLSLEIQAQQIDSHKYTPLPVTTPKTEMSSGEQQSMPYPQLLLMFKQQIICAKEMFDMLADFTKRLSERQ